MTVTAVVEINFLLQTKNSLFFAITGIRFFSIPLSPYEHRKAVELYDYEKDPLETVSQQNNPEYKDVLKDLKQKMLEHFKKYEK